MDMSKGIFTKRVYMLRVLVLLLMIIGFSFNVVTSNNDSAPSAVEICDNGIDDDGDGLIDLNDDDCQCESSLDSLLIPSSLIPNPSFEDTLCCPDNLAQLSCAKNWIQASDATSDYFNTCGFTSDRYRTIPPMPLPSGNGYVGFRDEKNYKEYVGTCLTDVMEFGVPYMLEFYVGFGKPGDFWKSSSPFHLSIYGSEDCANLPFGGPGYVSCPLGLNDWFEIAQVTVKGQDEWVKVSIEFTLPVDVSTLVVGPSCDAPKGENFYYLDDLILAQSTAFESANLEVEGAACDQVITLTGQKYRGVDYQWYLDGIAITGATKRIYDIVDFRQGEYRLRMSVMGECFYSEVYKHSYESFSAAMDTTICSGDMIAWEGQQIFNDGVFTAEYKTTKGCDSILSIDVKSFPEHRFVIDTSLCSGEFVIIGNEVYSKAGNYVTNMINQFGCDSIVELQLDIREEYNENIKAQLCEGQDIEIGSQVFTETGIYVIDLFTSKGCDSIINLDLVVNNITTAQIDTMMCVNDVIEIAGEKFFSSGEYEININNQAGCDSVITVIINTYPVYHMVIDTTICPSSILEIGNYSWEKEGVYQIEELSIYGCDSTTEVRLNIAEEIDPSIVLLNPISCNDDEDATIKLSVDGGYGKLSYNWNTGETNDYLDNLKSGTYQVTITDELGCQSSTRIEVINPEILTAQFESKNPTCANPMGGKIVLSFVAGGTPPYQLSINGEIMDDTAMKIHDFGPGDYEIVLIDDHDCMVMDMITFEEPGLGEIDILANKEIFVQGEMVDLSLEMFYINAPITSINWHPSSAFSCSTCEDVQTRLLRSKLEVSVEVTDENGCIYIRNITLKANSEYYLPNVFTPNGDGINDIFEIYSDIDEVSVVSFEVFDRWGNIVYLQSNFDLSEKNKFWDGQFRGKKVLPSTYVYRVLLEDHIGNRKQLSGDITLVR